MNNRKDIITGVRYFALTLVITLVYSINFLNLKMNPASIRGILLLLLMGLLQAVVIGYPVIRSNLSGWKLMLTLFFSYYAATIFMSQIEAVVFLQYLVEIMPVDVTSGALLNGAIGAAIISFAAVVIFKKAGKGEESGEKADTLKMPAGQWAWRTVVISLIYVVIYLIFGALVAKPLGGEAFDQYYAGLQMPPWIIPFQFIRGLIWVAITLPIVLTMKGKAWEKKLAVSLFLSVLISSLVIPPNEFMPPRIQFAHFVELFTSMFLFGWLVVLILTKRKR